jgi:hypothetical protein
MIREASWSHLCSSGSPAEGTSCAVTSQMRVHGGVLLSIYSVLIIMLDSTHSFCCNSKAGSSGETEGSSIGPCQDRASSARGAQCCQGSSRQHAPSLAAQRQACSGSPQYGPSPKMGSRLAMSGAEGSLYTTSASTGPLQHHCTDRACFKKATALIMVGL